MNYYGMIVRYGTDYSEVIVFAQQKTAFSSEDIIQSAVRQGILEQSDMQRVYTAQSIGREEYNKVKNIHKEQP